MSIREPSSSLLSLGALCQSTGGTVIATDQGAENRFCFSAVVVDSRAVQTGSLFVALPGETLDGHDFILDALKNGASAILLHEKKYSADKASFLALLTEFPDAVFIAVSRTLTALQKAAAAYVAQFPALLKVGITGSSGKTTTKEIVYKIFSRIYCGIRNKGNLNSEIGLPLSVFDIRREHEVGIFEMGMNRKDEIGELASILYPRYGVITNIGTAHIGLLGSRDAIVKEKKLLFSHFTTNCAAFIPVDDYYADFLTKGICGDIIRYGKPADIGINGVVERGIDGTSFIFNGHSVLFPLPGKHNFRNMLAAVALARYLGIASEKIAEGIESIQATFGRSQIFKGEIIVIQDCYNANPQSMCAMLDFCSKLRGGKIYILGDMLELGAETDAAHIKIIARALESDITCLVAIGNAIAKAFHALEAGNNTRNIKVAVFEAYDDDTIATVAEIVRNVIRKGDTVLIKGARKLSLERITPFLIGAAYV